MEASPTLVINYFNGFKQNVVPLFQRPYTWTEKQWRTLWGDVLVFYPENANDKATHFMGAVVTMPARSVPVGVSKWLIIDGQQRLTTISLLMCAVRDSVAADQQVFRQRIQQFYLTNVGSEGTELFKLLPTQGDREAYAPLIRETPNLVADSQFRKSYNYFRRRLREADSDGNKIDPKRILDIIEKRLMVVMINLSDTDDPYLIFESLNFKGSPLEQSDLVRNYFLMRFRVEDQQAVYDGLWLPMQNRLGQDLTEFMRHFLGAQGQEVRKDDVYTAIRRLVADADSGSVRLLMTRMERLSVLYSRASGAATEPQIELSKYFDYFRRLDFGSVYPLILALYEDQADALFGMDELIRTMAILFSFILRRMVVGVASNSLSGLFVGLCKNKPRTGAPSVWLSELLASESKNRRWPTDVEFAERWVRGELYGSRACRVILECIEESYGHHEMAGFEKSSVEHIMPQTLTPEWIEVLGTGAEKVHAEWLHTIGNLTLTGYNPELSNRSYREKRLLFADSHFDMNRHFRDCERWGSAEVELRAKSMFEIALRLWQRPKTSIIEAPAAQKDKVARASFNADCVRLAQQHLGVNLSKVSKTTYQSGDGSIRLFCAVASEGKKSRTAPRFWYGLHKPQVEFLEKANSPYLCFGCSSAETTLLVPFSKLRGLLSQLSETTKSGQHWNIEIQRKSGKFLLLLRGGEDGPDLTEFDIGSGTT